MRQNGLRFAVLVLFILLTPAGCRQATPAPEGPTAVPATATAPATTEPTPTASPEAPAAAKPLAPDGVPEESYYAPFPVSITLDGDFGDWEGVPRVTIPEEAKDYPDMSSITFAAAADDTHLYFTGDVTDHKIISGEHGTNYWNEDSVELYLNGTGDLSLASYRDGVAQITIPPLNIGRSPEESVVGGVRGDTVDARVLVVETDKGYGVEVAVPLKNDVWNIRLDHGNVIGFQVHLNGASTAGRDLKIIWSAFDRGDTSYQNPSVFGELIFFEIGQTGVTKVQPTPGPTAIPVPGDAAYRQADLPIDERLADLLERMTLAEKVGQMTLVEKNSIVERDIAQRSIGGLLSGGGGYPDTNTAEAWAEMVDGFQEYALESRLGIPMIYGVDAVHGHNNVYGAVVFPHNVGLGATGDPELLERIGRATAVEMIATGIYWNYAPCVAVPQDIRWGRTYEGYGEDPDLVSALGAAYIRGLQGDSLAAPDTVLATPKHFVGDGGTAWGSSTTPGYQIDQGVTDLDEATLRAVHLPPYEAAIEAGAKSIMVSFSSWGGTRMHAQEYLITEALKGEPPEGLGFDGFVVSDWGGIDQISDDYYEAVVAAINAGIDMNMVPHDYSRFIGTLIEAVESGDVSLERIDDAVRRILTVKFEMGLFDHPFSDQSLLAEVGSEGHRGLAREAVSRSLVLLKNDDTTLPLSKDAQSINVAGLGADDIGMQCGGWTIEWQGESGEITPGTTILEGIQSVVSANTTIDYDPYGHFEGPADVCVAVVGEEPYAEGHGDSDSLSLPIADLRMLRRLPDQCDRIVAVLVSGRPLIVTDYLEEWDAFVAAWLPGTEGQGVADALFGDVPFSGKLPYTWPRSVDQLPLGALQESGEEPLFPFGYGLP
ncbi:MAG: glycoside hydrolase family 3 C-terminal domain-containing protein [Anaerolineae bacterium]|nr:glycoside hydrolase family 3 C-terminal domain-containing protein [Anaerolineae bacterium]